MSIQTSIMLQCDECEHVYQFITARGLDAQNADTLREQAAAYGWTTDGNDDLCRACIAARLVYGREPQ